MPVAFLRGTIFVLFFSAVIAAPAQEPGAIDRHAVVTRHNVELTAIDSRSPLQVGNGNFAFNADITGLQTFYGDTLSTWGWHEEPLPPGLKAQDVDRTEFITHGRKRYYLAPSHQTDLLRWLAENPHRANLGRLRFMTGPDGAIPLKPGAVTDIHQQLDLWSGLLVSDFEVKGKPVHVETVCHADLGTVAVRITSPLLADGELGVALDFPYPTPTGSDWESPDCHRTEMARISPQRVNFLRTADAMSYHVALDWSAGGVLRGPAPDPQPLPLRILKAEMGAGNSWKDVTDKVAKAVANNRLSITVGRKPRHGDSLPPGRQQLRISYMLGGQLFQALVPADVPFEVQDESNRHVYRLSAGGKDSLSFVCAYSPQPLPDSPPSFEETKASSAKMWQDYWQSGGAIDLSASKDPRWSELERRVILSQYVERINAASDMPPPEGGLFGIDPWCSKFHLEMTAWHVAQFMFWGRPECMQGWVRWYNQIGLPSAEREAKAEGWPGAKWLKTPDPYGRWESWEYGPNRVTQNVHPLYLAELFYRTNPTRQTLETWKKIVFETATMMADFVAWDDKTHRYILGPPVMSGAEGNTGFASWNSTSELNYWAMGLEIAQKWRERLGLPRDPKWDDILAHLSRPPIVDGVYIEAESDPTVWSRTSAGHYLRPAWLEVYGCVRGPMIDPAVMERTYERVSHDVRSGQWKGNLWGVDYPMMAMTAARLGKTKEAVDWLLNPSPLNEYAPNGFCANWLSGNGGLLWAVAMMAAGWDGGPKKPAPGFPDDGSWVVKSEGLESIP